MSGHSHWSGIKQKKGLNDAKRAIIFTKLGKNITIAAKEGGGNPSSNFKLRLVVEQAQTANMPKDKIERAIKRGTGELEDAAEIQEVIYEAYGPGNVAMLIKTTTDNKNRTVGEIKNIVTKSGGKMVPSGSVGFLFRQVGRIDIETDTKNISDLELIAIDAGAEDTFFNKNILTVYTKSEELQKVKEGIEKESIKILNAGLIFAPIQKTTIDTNAKINYERLTENLEEHPDVQEIFDNL